MITQDAWGQERRNCILMLGFIGLSKMSPQTFVTTANLTPFVFGGIRNVAFGTDFLQIFYRFSERRKQLVNLGIKFLS